MRVYYEYCQFLMIKFKCCLYILSIDINYEVALGLIVKTQNTYISSISQKPILWRKSDVVTLFCTR